MRMTIAIVRRVMLLAVFVAATHATPALARDATLLATPEARNLKLALSAADRRSW